MTHEIEFKGLTITVEGNYYRGAYGNYEHPPEPSDFDINSVHLYEEDITELCEMYMTDIEQSIIDKYYS